MRQRGLTLRMSGVALCLATLVAATQVGAAAEPETDGASYLDARAPISWRVEDLLRRMTLAEKIGQMDQILNRALRDTANPADGNCKNAGGQNEPLQVSCLAKLPVK